MEKLAFTTLLKDDPALQAQYRAYHADIWPEVIKCFRAIGVMDMTIWQLGRQLFLLAEVDGVFDLDAGLSAYLKLDPKCQEWESIMDQFQEAPAESVNGEKWVPVEPLFALSNYPNE